MKSFTKSILAIGLTLGIVASIGSSAFCASHKHKDDIGGWGVDVGSDINYDTGSAYTSYGGYGTVSLDSYFNWCSVKPNGGSGTDHHTSGHYKYCSTSFPAHSNSKSVSIETKHYVSGGGEEWKTTTSDVDNR